MDEDDDAPEHPWVRWLNKLKGYDRTAFNAATWLVLAGSLFTTAGWSLSAHFQNLSFDLLDKLGWSLLQLGGAILIVNIILAKSRATSFKPLIEEAQFELKQLTAIALMPRFFIGPIKSLGQGTPVNTEKLDNRWRTNSKRAFKHRRDAILRAGIAFQHDPQTLEFATAILKAMDAEDSATLSLLFHAYDPKLSGRLVGDLRALQKAYKDLNTHNHLANWLEVQTVIDAIPVAIARISPSSADPAAP